MPRAIAGVLVKCDPSIKAIIHKINDQNNHDIIIEDIDDEHMLVKNNRHEGLKRMLKEALKDTVREAEESSGEEG
ncbi:hypothetical protein DOTSEDRAFT_22862 [Dothistroma septosporum NZE10]|uniref:General transcription and DNA repair factor IIH subunit TFB5 n=1 Tax=Dothistroma septosporum (strain NZE10 / CBS 128990) TaxID=675120 RepID=N1PWQ5_DOTSN|nr:hypothetical protein DOTSEDRAFT_22862 [Dothistroma septosporum NZE10]